MRSLILLAALILSIIGVRAQTFTAQHFGVNEGLPSSEVYHILQDSKGFLWFSTDNGVARYDGFQFKTFNVAEGLPDPVVFETMEDSLDQIWIRTYSGKIGYIKNERFRPYGHNRHLAEICQSGYLTNLMPGAHGRVWFSIGTVSGSIDPSGEIELDTTENQSLQYKTIERGFLITRGPNQFGYTHVLIDGKSFPIAMTDDPQKESHPVSQSIFWKGNLYLTINNNIFKYDGKSVQRVYRADHAIIMLSTDNKDNLWVGLLSGGVKRFATGDFTKPEDFPVLKNNSVSKVLEDHEGGL